MQMPMLHTERLIIRPFQADDLEAVHRISTQAFGNTPLEARREWLEWNRLNARWHAELHQPPYGDRAVVLRRSSQVIGLVGVVPSFGPFDQIPGFRPNTEAAANSHFSPEIGLFWATDVSHQRRGYATEAARAVIDYLFATWNLKRIVATTEYDNAASIGVMRRLGMTIERNPHTDPPWFQVAGLLNRPAD